MVKCSFIESDELDKFTCGIASFYIYTPDHMYQSLQVLLLCGTMDCSERNGYVSTLYCRDYGQEATIRAEYGET